MKNIYSPEKCACSSYGGDAIITKEKSRITEVMGMGPAVRDMNLVKEKYRKLLYGNYYGDNVQADSIRRNRLIVCR